MTFTAESEQGVWYIRSVVQPPPPPVPERSPHPSAVTPPPPPSPRHPLVCSLSLRVCLVWNVPYQWSHALRYVTSAFWRFVPVWQPGPVLRCCCSLLSPESYLFYGWSTFRLSVQLWELPLVRLGWE